MIVDHMMRVGLFDIEVFGSVLMQDPDAFGVGKIN